MRYFIILLLLALDCGAAAARGGNSGPSIAAPPREKTAADTDANITFPGPKSGWGFVQATSPYYSPQGKNLGTLPGGTPFKYTDVKHSSKNAMLVSTVRRGEAWEGPYLLDCADIVAYEGSPEALDRPTLQNLAAYFTIKGKIADRKAALAQGALAANPHYESARLAQQAYQDSIAKADGMEKQMRTLTGARKAKADDALRTLKYEQVRIKAKADQEAAAFKTWKDAHPGDPSKQTADPQLRDLEQALQAAKGKVEDLIPQS